MPDGRSGAARALDAAARLVVSGGARALTISAVAEEAGLSRGGVLYHFPSKEALIGGMLARMSARFDAVLAEEVDADRERYPEAERARAARAFLRASLRMDRDEEATFAGLAAAVAYDPSLLDPIRGRQREWVDGALSDVGGIDGAALVVASHALWLSKLFGLDALSGPEREAVVERLETLTLSA